MVPPRTPSFAHGIGQPPVALRPAQPAFGRKTDLRRSNDNDLQRFEGLDQLGEVDVVAET